MCRKQILVKLEIMVLIVVDNVSQQRFGLLRLSRCGVLARTGMTVGVHMVVGMRMIMCMFHAVFLRICEVSSEHFLSSSGARLRDACAAAHFVKIGIIYR